MTAHHGNKTSNFLGQQGKNRSEYIFSKFIRSVNGKYPRDLTNWPMKPVRFHYNQWQQASTWWLEIVVRTEVLHGCRRGELEVTKNSNSESLQQTNMQLTPTGSSGKWIGVPHALKDCLSQQWTAARHISTHTEHLSRVNICNRSYQNCCYQIHVAPGRSWRHRTTCPQPRVLKRHPPSLWFKNRHGIEWNTLKHVSLVPSEDCALLFASNRPHVFPTALSLVLGHGVHHD